MSPESPAAPSLGVRRHLDARVAVSVLVTWILLLMIAAFWSPDLDIWWPAWRIAFAASVVWEIGLLVLVYLIGPPFAFSRVPILSYAFALATTVFGSASYWATTELFPLYRVNIERAALFVAVCTVLSLLGMAVVIHLPSHLVRSKPRFVWDWTRLRVVTYLIAAVAAIGTLLSIQKLGYVPALRGDPGSERVSYASVIGVWFRVSMFGVVALLLAGIQICARRASWWVWTAAVVGLGSVAVYPNRFFAALPVGIILLLWDRVRNRIPLRVLLTIGLIGVPVLALLFFWRQQDQTVTALGPVGLVLYATLSEFRDLAWALDYWIGGDRFLDGSTLPGIVVPLLPQQAWDLVGIDKAVLFANSNAAVLAHEMGRETAQRIGLYGELFINFNWVGAFLGALLYGALLGLLDRLFIREYDGHGVAGILLALVIAAALYAQVGQWNMFTSAVTTYGYPILAVALLASHREMRPA